MSSEASGRTFLAVAPNVNDTQGEPLEFSLTLIKPRFSAAHKTHGKLCTYRDPLQDLGIGTGSTKFPSQIPPPGDEDFFSTLFQLGGWVEILILITPSKRENSIRLF